MNQIQRHSRGRRFIDYQDVERDFGREVADFMMPRLKPYTETIAFSNQVDELSALETLRRIESSDLSSFRSLVDRRGRLRDPNDPLFLNLLEDTRRRIVEPELRRQFEGQWGRDPPNKQRCLTAKMYVEGYDPFNGEERPVDDKACKLALAMCNPRQSNTGGTREMFEEIKRKCASKGIYY